MAHAEKSRLIEILLLPPHVFYSHQVHRAMSSSERESHR